MDFEEKQLKSDHCFGLGIERSDKIGSVLLLEADTGAERVGGVVLEDASGGVVDEDEAFLPADVGERERADDIGADGLDLVGLAPVDVGAAGDAGGVEDVGGLGGGDVGLEVGPVLEAARAVDVVDVLGLAELAEEAANPAGAPVDQELEGLS